MLRKVTVDVKTNFMPSSVLPLARRVLVERAAAAGIATALGHPAERLVGACQEALTRGSYSDAPANPRGRETVLREIAESPTVDELAGALTQFILRRYDGREPAPAQRQNARGFAHKRLGLFLNFVDGFIDPRAGEVRSRRTDALKADDQDQALEALVRPRRRSSALNVTQRRAIEQRAVEVASMLLASEGWTVNDVGATHSYDLHCSKPDDDELYVEVKGTTGSLNAIVLTANEVALARSHHPATALFVVHGIQLEGGPKDPVAVGGEVSTTRPWTPLLRGAPNIAVTARTGSGVL